MEKQKIIDPVKIELIKQEIKELSVLKKTSYGDNVIYITDYRESPSIMREIGRLREIAFRSLGGGSGKELDIDVYDTKLVSAFKQLFIWDPVNEEITGAYRYSLMKYLNGDSPTSHLFHFEDRFEKDIMPYAIELGRSFVNFAAKKARYALDNLWDGIGYLVFLYEDIKYFFGKMTFYPWNLNGKMDLIMEFLEEMFPTDNSVKAKNVVKIQKSNSFNREKGLKKNKDLLMQQLKVGEKTAIPPLVNAYMKLTDTMKYFGASVNVRFGQVLEGAILIVIADINKKAKERYIMNIV